MGTRIKSHIFLTSTLDIHQF